MQMDMRHKQQSSETKATSEEPVSLAPLRFLEALADLLKVRPKPQEESEAEIEEQEEKMLEED